MSEHDDLSQRRAFETYLIRKAWRDDDFKQRLVADPEGTFTSELQSLDPDAVFEGGARIRVVEETAQEICLVLPLDPNSLALDDAELDAVAGGKCGCKNDGCEKTFCLKISCKLGFGRVGHEGIDGVIEAL